MFRPLSAARMRSRFTTSASLKSSEISFSPEAGAEAGGGGGVLGVAWASIWRAGAAGTGELTAGTGTGTAAAAVK